MKKNVLLAVTILAACLSANAQFTTTKALKAGTAVGQRSAPQINPERIGKAAKVAKVANARFNPNLVPVKEVLSSRKLKDGSEFRLVRLENGMVKKQLLHTGKKLQRKIIPPAKSNRNVDLRAGAASGESLFEDFEGWDIETEDWDWIPEGWTDESKAGSTSHLVNVYGDEYNFTWRTSFFNPKSGQYSAGVQFAFPVDTLSDRDENGDGLLNDTVRYSPPPQDECLISPPVTVKQADYVFAFDLYYDPFWGRYREFIDADGDTVADFNATNTIVEALISVDGGSTWHKKWDNLKDVAQYTEEELWDLFYNAPWLRVSINLEEYHNRDIKIAIRYRDYGGESVYVDNVTVGYVRPEVSYRRPEGHLISGLSTDYYSLTEKNVIIGHAYTPTQWIGNVENQESISWSFNDSEGNPIQAFADQNPVVSLPYGLYETPLLTVTGTGGSKGEFQLGKSSAEDSQMGLGGQNIWRVQDEQGVIKNEIYGLGNYDLQYGIVIYSGVNAEDMAVHGTFKGVANYFEKPAAKYMFENFYVHAGNVVAKQDEPVKLNIYAVSEDGDVGEIIASSEAWPEEFIHAFSDTIVDDFGESFIDKYYTVPFTFQATDPETGRPHDSYLEIDNHFLAEFSNFQSVDMFFQDESHPTGEPYAYMSFEDELIPLGATSAFFDTDATFPFLFAEDNEFDAPIAGGAKEFEVGAYWKAKTDDGEWLWWSKEELPDWIEADPEPEFLGTGEDYIFHYTWNFTVAPLPEDVLGRSANVTVQAPGCEMTLKFKQGDADWYTGISTVSSNAVKVFSQGDRFVLACPAGTSSVAVYSVAGQKVAEYPLNSAGTCSIPAARLPKGVYILKFAGKTNETVKVVK